MTDCEKLKILSDLIETKLKEITNNKNVEQELIQIATFIYENGKINKKLPEPCYECAHCYDFDFYCKLLFDFINEKFDIKQLKEKLQYWDKIKATDIIIDNLPNNPKIFKNSDVNISGKKTVYFDFNIIDEIEKKEISNELKNNLNYIFTYSPIHLEEVFRMEEDYRKKRIKTISETTKNHVVLNMDKTLNIYLEKPEFSYTRVISDIGISLAYENYRVIKMKDRDVFFKESFDEKFAKSVNNKSDILSEISNVDLSKLLFFAGCSLQIEDFKKENKSYDEILHMIYSLFDVLDNIAFWRDKKEKTFKSSVYDIEHLIYATFCDFFITADERLSKRAIEIFGFMNLKTKIIHIPKEKFDISILLGKLNK